MKMKSNRELLEHWLAVDAQVWPDEAWFVLTEPEKDASRRLMIEFYKALGLDCSVDRYDDGSDLPDHGQKTRIRVYEKFRKLFGNQK